MHRKVEGNPEALSNFSSFAFSLCSFRFACLSLAVPALVDMPISEQQADEWAGSATADYLDPIPPNRIRFGTLLQMVDFSTAVIHCFVAGGPTPPILPEGLTNQMLDWCGQVLHRDEGKREACILNPSNNLAFMPSGEEGFRQSFGRANDISPRNNHVAFLRVRSSFSDAVSY